MSIETHPFKPFVPEHATILILGSFPGIHQTRTPNENKEWFYSAKRNQFWDIMEKVYSKELKTVEETK
jgi:G:T/U-mismatch repair DNA glycosylase